MRKTSRLSVISVRSRVVILSSLALPWLWGCGAPGSGSEEETQPPRCEADCGGPSSSSLPDRCAVAFGAALSAVSFCDKVPDGCLSLSSYSPGLLSSCASSPLVICCSNL